MPAAPTEPNLRSTLARRAALALAALALVTLALAARADAYIYWTGLDTTTTFTNAVGRASLDGTDIRPDFITDLGSPVYGMAADGNHIYWTHDPFVSGSIGGANFDGSDANDGLITPDGIVSAVTTDGTHLYWAEGGGFERPKIVRATSTRTGTSRAASTSSGTSAPRWGRRSSGWRSTIATSTGPTAPSRRSAEPTSATARTFARTSSPAPPSAAARRRSPAWPPATATSTGLTGG